MIRRLRVILPPDGAIITFIIISLMAAIPPIAFILHQGGPPPPALEHPGAALHGAAMMGFGAFRVLGFHPLYRRSYRRWLRLTPWTRERPLPAGPIRLVWEDLVLVSAAGLPFWFQGSVDPFTTVWLLLLGYLAALGPSFWSTGSWAIAYATLFGLGGVVGLAPGPSWEPATAAVLTLLIASIGLRRSLARWPAWADVGEEPDGVPARQANETAQAASRLGWPHDWLAPTSTLRRTSVSVRDGLLGSLLAGWWVYALLGLIPEKTSVLVIGRSLLFYLALFGSLGRLMRYTQGYSAPISLWGRVATFRWVIPRYDQVYVAPAVALAMGTAGPFGLDRMGVPESLIVPVATTLCLVAITVGGPSLRRWQLSAPVRMAASSLKAAGFIQIG